MYVGLHVKYRLFWRDGSWIFSTDFQKVLIMSYFIKIHPVGDKLYSDGRTDMRKVIVAFSRILWKCPKNAPKFCIWVYDDFVPHRSTTHTDFRQVSSVLVVLLYRIHRLICCTGYTDCSVVPDTDVRSNLDVCQSQASFCGCDHLHHPLHPHVLHHASLYTFPWMVQPSPRWNGPSVCVTSFHTLRPRNRIIICPSVVHTVSGTVATRLLCNASPLLPHYTASLPKFSRLNNYSSVSKRSTGCHETSVSKGSTGCHTTSVSKGSTGCHKTSVSKASTGCHKTSVSKGITGCHKTFSDVHKFNSWPVHLVLCFSNYNGIRVCVWRAWQTLVSFLNKP